MVQYEVDGGNGRALNEDMGDSFDIDADLIRKLAGLLEETGLGEIEFESAGARIRVARPAAVPVTPVVASPATPSAANAPETPADAPLEAHPGAVTSPMVGTIYLSPAPGEPPLAKIGDTVAAGQPLMLIEAMKTFNEVKAPQAGKLVNVAVESGQPVEFGEILAIIE